MTYTEAIRALGTVHEGLSEQPGLQTEALRVLVFLRRERLARRLIEGARASKPKPAKRAAMGAGA